jgi:hypothetical protein
MWVNAEHIYAKLVEKVIGKTATDHALDQWAAATAGHPAFCEHATRVAHHGEPESHVRGGAAIRVDARRVGAKVEQDFYHVGVVSPRRRHEWSHPPERLEIELRAMLKEDIPNLIMAFVNSKMERRLSAPALCIDM